MTVVAQLQDLGQIEKDHQPSFEFGHASHVIHAAILKEVVGRFDFRGWNPDHFGSGIHEQSNQALIYFSHDNAIFAIGDDVFFAKSLAQVHYRHDLAAEIDDALDVSRGIWH